MHSAPLSLQLNLLFSLFGGERGPQGYNEFGIFQDVLICALRGTGSNQHMLLRQNVSTSSYFHND